MIQNSNKYYMKQAFIFLRFINFVSFSTLQLALSAPSTFKDPGSTRWKKKVGKPCYRIYELVVTCATIIELIVTCATIG